MPGSNEDGDSHLGAYVPHNLAEAVFQLANTRSTRSNRVTQSDIIREAVREYVHKQDDLPGEIRDLLDEDLIANAGGDEFEDGEEA